MILPTPGIDLDPAERAVLTFCRDNPNPGGLIEVKGVPGVDDPTAHDAANNLGWRGLVVTRPFDSYPREMYVERITLEGGEYLAWTR